MSESRDAGVDAGNRSHKFFVISNGEDSLRIKFFHNNTICKESRLEQRVTNLTSEVMSPSSANFEALEFAVIIGDSSQVRALLSSWPQQGSNDQSTHSLTKLLIHAIEAKDTRVVKSILATKMPFNLGHVQLAIETKADAILQLFLDHGWNINECIDWASPQTLSLVVHAQS